MDQGSELIIKNGKELCEFLGIEKRFSEDKGAQVLCISNLDTENCLAELYINPPGAVDSVVVWIGKKETKDPLKTMKAMLPFRIKTKESS